MNENMGAGFIINGECTLCSTSLKLGSRGADDTKIYKRMER